MEKEALRHPEKICRRYLVSGRVQGVWYRASKKERAEALGITGHARNLEDGRVEVVACGAPRQLDLLEQWLREGPPLAEVESVERSDIALRGSRGFQTA